MFGWTGGPCAGGVQPSRGGHRIYMWYCPGMGGQPLLGMHQNVIFSQGVFLGRRSSRMGLFMRNTMIALATLLVGVSLGLPSFSRVLIVR